MEDEVLFQITKANLDTGLRGFPVGTCVTSTVHPEKGLFYADLPVHKLASWIPEEVIFLLYHGREGSKEENRIFKNELIKRATLSQQTIQEIRKFPRGADPMRLFAIALLFGGLYESVKDYREDALNLIARVPEMVAHIINHHAGWKQTPPSKPELGTMENFARMLTIPGKLSPQFPDLLKLFDILHLDHGGGNLSTFVGKAVASGLEDLYGSLSSAMCALAGPRHGRANQECYYFVQEILQVVGPDATLTDVERVIREKLSKGELIFGFGHAVLRVEDPRATVQYDFAMRHFGDNPLVKIALLLRVAGTKVLKENPKISNPYPNVDAISGVLLSAAGFPYPEYFPVLFGLSRVVGIAIQIVYERSEARGGKGLPIVRPKYLYKTRQNP
jgi:citrate synthase